ncbi:KilA-N domain-containing protein [Bacteroides fragilis]
MFNNSVNQIFQYNGSPITFQKGDSVMVNATEMAKPFGKLAKDWLSNKSTKEFLSTLSSVRTIPLTALVEIKQGGNKEQGTWMHEDVAMEFARWLSPAFAIWCNDRIKELLTIGMTATQPTLEQMIDNPDLVIHLATQLKQEREEKAKLEAQTEQQQVVIEQKEEEISIKDEKIKVLAPKGDSFDKIMSSQGLVTTNMIAAFLGISAIKLNKLLCDWDIQYKQSGIYFLHTKYRGKGYTKHVPHPYLDNGVQKSREHMYWTEKGRKFVIDLYNSKMAA